MSPDPSLGGAAPHEDSGDQDDQCDRAGGGRRQCPSLQARPRHGGVAGTDAASDDDRRQAAAARHAAALPWQAGRSRTDKAFDSNAIIADLNARGAKIVISQHPRRARSHPLDEEMYKWRHLIENFFCKLKEFKRIATPTRPTPASPPSSILPPL